MLKRTLDWHPALAEAIRELDGPRFAPALARAVSTLKQDALAYVGSLFRGAPRSRWGWEAGIWVLYVTLSAASVAAFVAFNVWMIAHAVA